MPIENHVNIPRDMTASGSTSQYVLGSTDAEQERLIRQAACAEHVDGNPHGR